MLTRTPLVLVICAAAGVAACSRVSPGRSTPTIRLDTTTAPQAIVRVDGLVRRDREALAKAALTEDEWSTVLRVTVKGTTSDSSLALAGRHVVGDSVTFTPAFPLDPGRHYEVSFDPSAVSRAGLPHLPPATADLALPALARTPSTVVTAVYPSGEVLPANLLRMYVQFSAPMGQQGGLDHIVLLDRAGREVVDAMLPLDTELWNADRTRYTVLFDPGRVKREVLPNRRMGRPLRQGERITLVVKADWRDARGVPLESEFRRDYRIGPADERPLATGSWQVAAPDAGTREALTVTFPEPLDHGLLQRALAVAQAGATLAGEVRIEPGERCWTFVPREPWRQGQYAVTVLPILEDLAGNRVGRAFEVLSPGDAVPPEDSRPVSLPFRIAPAAR